MSTLRLGRIGYINCYPVYGAIDRGAVPVPAELVTGTPAELNDLLVAGELDLSVISAVEFARHSDALRLLPGIGITSDGPVKSVALFSRRPVGELDGRTVLLTARRAYPHRIDLGEEWTRWTRLPFVFAVWAARRAADRATVDRVHEALLRSRDWGLAHLDELATAAHRATGVSTPECRDYFAGLDYAFTDRHLAGLGTFFRKLAAHGLAPAASLRYLEVA